MPDLQEALSTSSQPSTSLSLPHRTLWGWVWKFFLFSSMDSVSCFSSGLSPLIHQDVTQCMKNANPSPPSSAHFGGLEFFFVLKLLHRWILFFSFFFFMLLLISCSHQDVTPCIKHANPPQASSWASSIITSICRRSSRVINKKNSSHCVRRQEWPNFCPLPFPWCSSWASLNIHLCKKTPSLLSLKWLLSCGQSVFAC